MSVSPVTLARLSGTRMMTDSAFMSEWYAGDWDYSDMCDEALKMYAQREMSGSYESVSFYTYLGMLSELVQDGAKNGESSLQRAHCTAMSVMFADMRGRIDREGAELSALLDSYIWDPNN